MRISPAGIPATSPMVLPSPRSDSIMTRPPCRIIHSAISRSDFCVVAFVETPNNSVALRKAFSATVETAPHTNAQCDFSPALFRNAFFVHDIWLSHHSSARSGMFIVIEDHLFLAPSGAASSTLRSYRSWSRMSLTTYKHVAPLALAGHGIFGTT